MNNFLGQSNFIWFVGQVENNLDPQNIGRVQVRAFGIHPNDTSVIPTSDLPWCQVILPAISGFSNTNGKLSTGLQIGSQVIGFFLDGPNLQHPIIWGSFMGMNDSAKLQEYAKNAANKRLSTKDSNALFTEPSLYSPVYPNLSVESTKSGHLFETDDSPGAERLLTQHKSGTFEEIQPDGSKVTKILSKDYEIVLSDKNIHIHGNKNELVDGDLNVSISGNINLTVHGDVTQKVSGTTNISSSTALNIKSTGPVKISGLSVTVKGTTMTQTWT